MTPEEFTEHAGPLRRELLAHCYRMLGAADEAEDLVQETYLRAWRAHGTFEGRLSVRTWLYRIATNACLNALEDPAAMLGTSAAAVKSTLQRARSAGDWRMIPTVANGQPAVAAYHRDGDGTYQALGVAVLTVSPAGIARITVFGGGADQVGLFGCPRTLSSERGRLTSSSARPRSGTLGAGWPVIG